MTDNIQDMQRRSGDLAARRTRYERDLNELTMRISSAMIADEVPQALLDQQQSIQALLGACTLAEASLQRALSDAEAARSAQAIEESRAALVEALSRRGGVLAEVLKVGNELGQLVKELGQIEHQISAAVRNGESAMTQEGRVLAGCVAGMRDPKMRAHLVNCLLRTAMGDAWPYDQSPPGGVDPRTTAQRDGRQVLALFDAQNASKVEGVS